MPSSPRTPTRRRHPSVDLSFSSPNGSCNGYSHVRTSHSRKSSLYSPSTPRPTSSQGTNGFTTISSDFVGMENGGDGLGSLADELAEAWDEDGEGEEGVSGLQTDGPEGNCKEDPELPGEYEPQTIQDREFGVASSPALGQITNGLSSSARFTQRSKNRRKPFLYDGSEHGDTTDLEEDSGASPALEARIAIIEELARQGMEENEGQTDGVIGRVIDGLKDLGGQSGVENGATRLITAHTALSSHMTQQTRTLQTLTYSIFSPMALPPDPQILDELLLLMTEASSVIPQPTTSALSSLRLLSTYTMDLIESLNNLSDTLHMSRQTNTLATRRLRSSRELVAEIKKEADAREEGVRWIEKGDWQVRLAQRECAAVCGDIVGGFEEVCQGWRERLLASAEVIGA
ncbi:MAG: hypothetical protein M1830_004022 [Pleopsidium flavum]|nr:MAG: hypothetical protein M1830_004022 [Pleopsidium flavum]